MKKVAENYPLITKTLQKLIDLIGPSPKSELTFRVANISEERSPVEFIVHVSQLKRFFCDYEESPKSESDVEPPLFHR